MESVQRVRVTKKGQEFFPDVTDTKQWIDRGWTLDTEYEPTAPESVVDPTPDAKEPELSSTPPDGTTTPDANASG